ncbi:MAG TPA: DEAD/DEAH box helicase [Candidatus Angelobacter sp.]|jgi:ATP-dependent RNA helicase HelY|nr:DEAD/DEAH box helicase [Candidatus Angelobacter sp.]
MSQPVTQSAQSLLDAFQATLPWPLDPFQVEAIEKLESHHGVLVSAPTSSGKTVIADYAIFRALQTDTRAIYTTPLKALSNQKYRDYRRLHGEGYVGLVTGENTINPLAPVVVMTTEILRNLIYEDPERLKRVRYVILDEVHYIDDFPRGAVWEEIIIQAPGHIKFIGLSATISNFPEVAEWMSVQRGDVATVSVTKRPVELRLWLSVRNEFYPLLDEHGSIPRETRHAAQAEDSADFRLSQLRRPPENDLLPVVDRLRGREFVPAIYFIFSRRGCREALARCAGHGFDLTTPAEKAEIDELVKQRLEQIEDRDEAELYMDLLDGETLRRGLAMHHAGLLPYLKELVEELFQRGLIKVVFATETLSLGIHMPARACVVSSFTKFDGRDFAVLTSGELTQLMGRAGRRGIDPIGHGVVLKEPDIDIGTIYEAATGEEMTVESKFAPTYNMALNLLRYHTPDEVDLLMERSFGQYQKTVARGDLDLRLSNLRQRLADVTASRFQAEGEPCCTEKTFSSFVRAEETIASLRTRMRQLRREHWRGRGRRRRRATREAGGETLADLKEELQRTQQRLNRLPCRKCRFLAEHRAHHAEVRELQTRIRASEHDAERSEGEYRRKMHALRGVLEELGFLEGPAPTDKGLLAARIYGENSLIITQAIADGWLEELTPAELAASLVMVTAEDRNRDRPRPRRRFPTSSVALAQKRLRILYYRFSARERERGEDNLRPLSTDYVDFTYDWCTGRPLTEMQAPIDVELGDAVKALKGLYSALRQIEWAVTDRPTLRKLVLQARESLERDLITRI